MTKEEIQLIISGQNLTGPAVASASLGVQHFAANTIGHFRQMTGMVLNLQSALGGLAAYAASKAVFAPAMEMETFDIQFETLLGSLSEAKKRMADLSQFAADTPFELPELTTASRILQTLTKGALATGDGLTMVGDVAASVSQPVQELATWFGRLYDGIQSGRPVGEALARLQEMGIVSGDLRAQIEAMQKANESGTKIWQVVEQAMGQYEGGMQRLSRTATGLASTLSDTWEAARRDIGEAALPALKEGIASLIEQIEQLRESGELEQWGEALGEALTNTLGLLTGLAKFVAANAEALKTLGFSYVVYRTLVAANGALLLIRASLEAAGVEATKTAIAMRALETSAGFLATSGIVFLILKMRELNDEYEKFNRQAERAERLGGLPAGRAKDYSQKGFAERLVDDVSTAFSGGARDEWYGSTGFGANTEEQVAEARKAANVDATLKAQAASRDQADASRRKAADKAIADAARDELARRRDLVEKKKALADLERQIEKQRHDALNGLAAVALQDQASAHTARLAELQREHNEYVSALDRAATAEQAALQRLLNPEAAKQQDEANEEQAKAIAKLERRIKSARRRESELMRGGDSQDEARAKMTKKGREVLDYDDLRTKRYETEAVAAGKQSEIETEQAILANIQAQLAAAQREETKLSLEAATAAAELRDRLRDLTKEIGKLQAGDQAWAGVPDAQLEAAAKPEETLTPEQKFDAVSKMAPETLYDFNGNVLNQDELDAWSKLFQESLDAIPPGAPGQPADAGVPKSPLEMNDRELSEFFGVKYVPPSLGIPDVDQAWDPNAVRELDPAIARGWNLPPVPAAPGDSSADLVGEMKAQTRILEQIAKAEGVR